MAEIALPRAGDHTAAVRTPSAISDSPDLAFHIVTLMKNPSGMLGTGGAAAAYSGSPATISEGARAVVDSGNPVLLPRGLSRARRPPSAQFPFGPMG